MRVGTLKSCSGRMVRQAECAQGSGSPRRAFEAYGFTSVFWEREIEGDSCQSEIQSGDTM